MGSARCEAKREHNSYLQYPKVMSGLHQAARELRLIIDGATVTPLSAFTQRHAAVVHRMIKKDRINWDAGQGTISQTLRSEMQSLGWTECGVWQWVWNDASGEDILAVDLTEIKSKDELRHIIRESFRAKCWAKFISNDGRRESRDISIDYPMVGALRAASQLRKMELSPQELAFVTGNFTSPAAFASHHEDPDGQIALCPQRKISAGTT